MKHLITGGAGFIGCNLAARLIKCGEAVTIFDNLSRPRTPLNLAWLREASPNGFTFIEGDVRDAAAVRHAASGHDVIYHLAGQVAVTTSVQDPRSDFEINALGTLNVLEAARALDRPPIVLFASTNKVYGEMETLAVREEATRYRFIDLPGGVPETHPLDFHSPYGCSKGAADQYVHDYARIYGLSTVVFRQSCIYGQRQFGVEDQGWAAHFVIAALQGREINIYGNGKQVRDMLYVDDLIDVYLAAVARIDEVAGQVYNVGGGPANSVSIWAEFGLLLEKALGQSLRVRFGDWRPGDQSCYVSNIDRVKRDLAWEPKVGVEEGIERLVSWTRSHRELFVSSGTATPARP